MFLQCKRWPKVAAAALQTDGQVVVAGVADAPDGVFRVARYDPNGVLDPTFGTGGVVTGPDGPSLAGAGRDFTSVAIQADGKIVLGGATADTGSNAQMRVVRYDATGVLDPSFGCDQPPCSGFGDAVSAAIGIGMTLQADNKILLAGTQLGEFGQNIPVVARFDNPLPGPPPEPVEPVPPPAPMPPEPVVRVPTFTG